MFEISTEKDIDPTVRGGQIEKIRAQGKHVGVIVIAAEAHFFVRAADGSAHPMLFVSGDAHARAGGTNQDAAFSLTGGNMEGDGMGVIGIVRRIAGMSAEIFDLMPQFAKARNQLILHQITSMVCADCYFHADLIVASGHSPNTENVRT